MQCVVLSFLFGCRSDATIQAAVIQAIGAIGRPWRGWRLETLKTLERSGLACWQTGSNAAAI